MLQMLRRVAARQVGGDDSRRMLRRMRTWISLTSTRQRAQAGAIDGVQEGKGRLDSLTATKSMAARQAMCSPTTRL